MSLHEIFRYIGEPEPVQRRIQTHANVVEYQLAFDSHLQLLLPFLELPCEETVSRQAGGDAVLLSQIARGFGAWMSREVIGGAHDRHPDVRANAHRDHILGD